MWKLSVVLIFFTLITLSSAQFIQIGQCDPSISTNAEGGFSIEGFTGTWYETATSGDYLTGGDCSSLDFSYNTTSGEVILQHTAVFNNFYREQTFVASVDNDTAKFTIYRDDGSEIDYWVLVTNTDFYAAVYSCENVSGTQRRVHIWQLERNTEDLSDLMLAHLNTTLIATVGLHVEALTRKDHTEFGCYILPVIEEGQPIVLEGQCNPNMTVVQDFNVAAFLDEWHQIASYPSENSVGDCPRAEYSLRDGVVIVQNNEVINETLRVIWGEASVIGEDNSGKLRVVLEIAPGVSAVQDLWVLETDYTSFAVLYSCQELANNTRRIYSWITSRQSTLSADAEASVNAVIDRYVELNHEYYIKDNTTHEACFYYPEPDVDDFLILRGQCDEDIEVVTNFDPVRYQNLWHEIEAYSNPFQTGTCTNALYLLNDGVVDVYNTQVINQRLDAINGIAVLAFSDGSAKLNVTFPILGTNLTTTSNYWVLDTDYDSYSLVYSCTNLPLNRQSVFAWKLSRTKELTENASIAIENKINEVQALHQQYFQPTDQSPEGCFFFPEPELGRPVEFPGQCDENMTVVENFNFAEFEGVWYEIEAYPKVEQDGMCVSHEFNATGNTMDLISTQIVNQFLFISSANVSFTSNDNSAKLNININTNGTSIDIPYWILSANYTDYALAYSCVNLNESFRGIWSWKLSRTKELSSQANENINAVINEIVVLDNVYYEPIGQSEDDCFFLPEIEPGQPIILPGRCDPNITVVQNFDAVGYEGLWHLIETYYAEFQNGDCQDATYTLVNDTVDVFNTQVINQTLDTINGYATLATDDGSAKLLVYFPGIEQPGDYWVLDTDYTSYALVYSCIDLPNDQRRVFSWKLSRSRSLTQEAEREINEVIDRVQVLNNVYFEPVNQSPDVCFYYPEPNGNPVRLRGQCDLNIPVVTDFDAVAYQGLWHDTASYPTSFQQGTCNNAYYTLVDGVVNVFNTQVLNQTLDTINGVAVLATDDGSAKLTVTFPIEGTNLTTSTSYWVLDTDYTSYSLVYTCENLNEDERMVFAWKLSRTKTLSSNASTQMDAIIQTIPVLDDRYFEENDQSDEGCFYFPEPQPGVPVEFPGGCDGTINVTQNFNLTLFAGEWFEIEAYPKVEQNGQCISHDYTVEGNSFSLISTQVINQFLDVYGSNVTVVSNDNSAKLSISLYSNGVEIIIPFWIIDTDYSSYALAYSCVDYNLNSTQGDNTRGVWSWKLSRTKELPQQAAAAINSSMTAVDVIDNRYFESIGQSDDDCFYLPELEAGEPVIFVGQCDPNITVVQDFRPTDYQGLWHLIESYPSEFQLGSCNNARYTLEDGVVNVLNTEVINETLSSMPGTAVLATDDGSGKLLVSFGGPELSDYWILDTDYNNYSLVYSCTNLPNNQRRVFSWKLSRTRQLSNEAIAAINNKVDEINVLNQRYFEVMDQSDDACFYYPEVDETKAVLFRGRCDPNITVVQDFNVTRYLGLWHDVESYPQEFQLGGTCPEATYSLNEEDGTVNVFNTQVVNQQLDSINGVATLATDDGSAKLLVTFPIAGTDLTITSNYWVLDTDYTSYSLVYNCEEVDDEYRRVTTWKLSRNKTLSDQAYTNINNAIRDIKVLDQRYYREPGQSEDDCFYYPDNNGGPVYWDGQCEDVDISAVENFNLNNFLGTWHEVSRIPSDLQSGECENINFSGTANNLALSKTSVENEVLLESLGSATLVDGQRGILNTSFNTPSGPVDLTLYVLGTDYNNYALLYSCSNINSTRRQVFSWKLSKSRSGLSPAANDIVNGLVNDIKDITENYFQNTDQSVLGCFYYPDYSDTGLPQSIILPGPCQDIQTVSNFNPRNYVGRWYEIARYPQPSQTGQCNQPQYTEDGGVGTFYKNEVVNGSLSEITGTAVASNNGVISVTFENVVEDFYIIDTDYTSYSVVFSCRTLDNDDSLVFSWQLSRDRTLSPQATQAINNLVNTRYGLREEYYVATDQSDEACFYIPTLRPNEPVQFRGSCDESITGQEAFDLNRYLGWWHKIESYPTEGNTGVCRSVQYEQSGNTVTDVTTSVFNDTAEVTSAIVTATNNGRITRTINGEVVEEYWVLATNYDDYSLVYSCENNGEYRKVWSAKYSKTRTLTETAQNTMLAIINQNPVLVSDLYIVEGQSSEDCFHYPNNQGQRVILPGQCDTNIPVKADFNAAEYTGTWYQMERYPQPFETEGSSCTGARYTLNTDTGVVSVLNWEVIAGTLVSLEGTAAQTNVPPILDVTLPIVGTENNVTTQLYVLDTDYITYSLVYSCENVDPFRRAVGAWKLSRTRTMPESGTLAINTYMSNREELYQDYFIQVYHDDNCEEPSSAFLARSSIIVILICMALHNLF